jgi:hypothetical protein
MVFLWVVAPTRLHGATTQKTAIFIYIFELTFLTACFTAKDMQPKNSLLLQQRHRNNAI